LMRDATRVLVRSSGKQLRAGWAAGTAPPGRSWPFKIDQISVIPAVLGCQWRSGSADCLTGAAEQSKVVHGGVEHDPGSEHIGGARFWRGVRAASANIQRH